MTIYDRFGRPVYGDQIAPPVIVRGATWANNNSVIALPVNNVPIIIPEDCKIEKVNVLTDGAAPGSCQLDIWKLPFGSFPPDSSNSICASDLPTITAGITYMDSVLTGWDVDLNADDTLLIVLVSTTVFKAISLSLYLRNAT